MGVNNLFQFCAISVHTILDSFSGWYIKLSGIVWTQPELHAKKDSIPIRSFSSITQCYSQLFLHGHLRQTPVTVSLIFQSVSTGQILCASSNSIQIRKSLPHHHLWSQAQGSTFLICDKNSTIPGIPNSCLLASLEASGKFLFFLRSVRAIKDTNSPFSLTIGSFPVIQEEALYIKNGQYTFLW